MRARPVLPVLAVLGCFAGHLPAMAGPFTGIVAFGDSLSDAGNVFIATGGAEPAPPYFDGHFSNGLTWVEDLSQNLGLGTLRPSLAGGTDFAFGGALTGNSVPNPPPPNPPPPSVPNIAQQVGQFLISTGGVAPSTDLYTMWIGSNDVIQAVTDVAAACSPVLPTCSALSLIESALGLAAHAEADAVSTLANAGAKTFVVPLIADIGKAPVATTVGLEALATQLSALYNTDLIGDLNAIGGGVTIDVLDTFSLTDAIVSDPGAFNLMDVSHACYGGTYFGGGSACPAPDTHLYWDAVHPTEAGHQLFATLAEQSVPEPASLTLFATALVAFGALRRRRRKAA